MAGRWCPGCGLVVLVGLDADVAALPAVVDPRLVTLRGEARALARGRTSYQLVGGVDAARLEYRDAFAVAGRPANRVDVLVSHSCDDALAADSFRPADTTAYFPPQDPDY